MKRVEVDLPLPLATDGEQLVGLSFSTYSRASVGPQTVTADPNTPPYRGCRCFVSERTALPRVFPQRTYHTRPPAPRLRHRTSNRFRSAPTAPHEQTNPERASARLGYPECRGAGQRRRRSVPRAM